MLLSELKIQIVRSQIIELMQKTNKSSSGFLINSFGFALEGIKILLTERNFRIHIVAGSAAIAMGVVLRISSMEWCIIAIAIGMVLSAEAFNSAIEQISNRVTLEQDSYIKKVKDISAGAVLIVAVVSLVVGLFIFLPKIV